MLRAGTSGASFSILRSVSTCSRDTAIDLLLVLVGWRRPARFVLRTIRLHIGSRVSDEFVAMAWQQIRRRADNPQVTRACPSLPAVDWLSWRPRTRRHQQPRIGSRVRRRFV